MSVTAVVFLVVYAGGLILAFRWPILGLCTYIWAFYNHPPAQYWADEVPELRWSLIAAVVTLVAYTFHSVLGTTQEVRRNGRR